MNQADKQFLRELKSATRNGQFSPARAAAMLGRFRSLQRATPLKQQLAATVRNAVAVGFRRYAAL